jgi:hypothetical protein
MMSFFMFSHQKQSATMDFGGKYHLVTDFIVHGVDDFDVTFGKGDDLVCALRVFAS